jgi:serine/threonine protein kinase
VPETLVPDGDLVTEMLVPDGDLAPETLVPDGDLEPDTFVPDGDIRNEMGDDQEVLHNSSIRHGNLKPENILNFQYGEKGLGRLKIADMGLTKRHIVATGSWSHQIDTEYDTVAYEAPEMVTTISGRSRFSDIWSIGCIIMDFVIWNLYGYDELNRFYMRVRGNTQHTCPYFEVSEVTGSTNVHRVVSQWLYHILNTESECSQESAILDLLKVVQTRLLVVQLPGQESSPERVEIPEMGETDTACRATARELREALDTIISKADRPDYLVTGNGRGDARPPAPQKENVFTAWQRMERPRK